MGAASATLSHAEDRTPLRNISWETYLRLSEENTYRSNQLAYFAGQLEVMTVGLIHESASGQIRLMLGAIAEALRIDFEEAGQTTFQHHIKRIGFQSDLSYYIAGLKHARGKTKLNLVNDPPPDLVVEVDISRNSERKLLMYAALGIPEVWRYEANEFHIYRLHGAEYRQAAESAVLGRVRAALLTQLLSDSARMSRPDWLARVRQTVR